MRLMHDMRRGTNTGALFSKLARRRRRGTVLLLVLGALAMVLILTVVYAALGKGDRNTAQSTQLQQDSRDIIGFLRNYAANVLRDDVFDLAPDLTEERLLGTGNEDLLVYRRENTDAPLTDFTMRSVPSLDDDLDGEEQAIQELYRFRPSGGHATGVLWPDDPNLGALDPRLPSDPWLADTRPFDLGPGSKEFLADGSYFNNAYYERAVDWKQISNFAPDGGFVNISFLRPELGGGFDVPSLDLRRDPDTGEARLGLFDANGDLQMGNDAELGFLGLEGEVGVEIPFDASSATPDWNRPAHWTMYQRAMHRAVAELNRLDSANNPGTPAYWRNQYADADGNGFIDSRWFELTDASLGTEVTLLPSDGRRYFVAMRAIDLSSLVNVNTASDLVAPPTQDDRIGAGPFETSLFSLLSMTWHPRLVSGVKLGVPTQIDYGSGGNGSLAGAFDFPDLPDSGDDYTDVSNLGVGEPVLSLLGRKAYKRVRQSIVNWEALPYEIVPDLTVDDFIEDADTFGGVFRSTNTALYTLAPTAAARSGSYIAFGSTPPAGTVGGNARIGPFGLDDLIELLTYHGGNDPDVFTPLEAALVSENRSAEDELGSRSLLRSDRSLEAEVGDRIDLPAGTDGDAGVGLRESNRLARAQVDIRSLLTTVSGARPLRSRVVGSEGVGELGNGDRKLRLDDVVLAPAVSYTALPAFANDETIQRALVGDLIDNAFFVYLETLAPYLDASAWDPDPAAVDGSSEPQQTQYYGQSGPELALRLAAHLALNFRDMADAPTIDDPSDADTVADTDLLGLNLANPADLALYELRLDEPTRALLWLTSDAGRRQAARDALPAPAGVPEGLLVELETQGMTLDADEFVADPAAAPQLDNGDPATPSATQDALILYGLEAQPFLGEVAFMTAYVDTPRGDDDEDSQGQPDAADPGDPVAEYRLDTGSSFIRPDESNQGMINIDGSPSPDNQDFFFQIIAFQLFNPFDVPVRLDDMYLEFGNRFYRFSDVNGGKSLVLDPFETVIAYATNPGLDLSSTITMLHSGELQVRFDGIQSDIGSDPYINPTAFYTSTQSLDDIFDSLLGSDLDIPPAVGAPAPLIRRMPLQRFDSDLDEIPADATGPLADLLDPDPVLGSMMDETQRTQRRANQTAMLWWDLGDKADLPAGDWELVDRRDDVMLDRLTDRDSVINGTAPILDQRLFLEDQLILETIDPDSNTVILGEFIVENALKGYVEDQVEGIRGDQPPGSLVSSVNLNLEGQHSAFYWGKLRRHDDPSAGVAATALLNTADLLSSEPRLPTPDFSAVASDPASGVVPLTGIPAGALPAAVLEPVAPISGVWDADVLRSSVETTYGPNFSPYDSLNAVDSFDDGGGLAGPFRPETAVTFSEFVDRLAGEYILPGSNDPNQTLPNRFLSTKAPKTSGIFWNAAAGTQYIAVPDNAGGVPYGEEYITFANNGTEFRSLSTGVSQLRVGDMLLPMAVGPYRRPLEQVAGVTVDDSSYPSDPNERIAAYEREWVTLGEVLAEVSGYSDGVVPSDPATGAPVVDADVFNNLRDFDPVSGDETRRVLDRGKLRLDAFVPYFDAAGVVPSGGGVLGVYDPGFDRVRGYGVPLATTIFEIAQAGGEMPLAAYGGLARPVTGVVNINTAPPSVMRLLPGLFPDTYDDRVKSTSNPADDTESRFWDGRLEAAAEATGSPNALPHLNAFEAPEPFSGGNSVNQQTDIASSILAYREPSRGHVLMNRFQNLIFPAGGGLGQAYEMNPEGLVPDDPAMPTQFDASGGLAVGRSGVGIEALRRAPGIGSLGELLAVRLETPPDQNPHQSMTWLGRDGKTLGMSLIDAATAEPVDLPTAADEIPGRQLSTLDPDLFGDPYLYRFQAGDMNFAVPGPDHIADDYDEQLVQINMLLNSASVSSDYYAIWMLVHGFAREDVEDLSETDPLVPSFRGRYLMIIDRSNVVEPGDSPRILAFLPLPTDVPVQAQLGDLGN